MRSPPLVSGLPCWPTRCSRESRPDSEHNRVDWSPSSKNFTGMKFLSQGSGELRQMVRCLELYYRQARSQKDIAKTLGVSAATVSRLLKRAMDEGFVRVELDLPRTEALETALAQAFGLREAIVIVGGGRGDLKAELGTAAALHFEKLARNGMKIGLSCGFTLYPTTR